MWQLRAFSADGGEDVRTNMALSSEVPEWSILIGTEDQKKNTLKVSTINVEKREYLKLYMEYWNSTAELTGTGRLVNGLVCPVVTTAAIIPG